MSEVITNCCGVYPRDQYDVDAQRCPECKENCTWINEADLMDELWADAEYENRKLQEIDK